MRELTPSAKWQSVVAGAKAMMAEVQPATYARWGIDYSMQYEWNLERAEMVFSRNGIAAVRTDLLFAGSVSASAGTWLWGWANETIPARLTQRFSEVRLYGEEQKFAKLVEPWWPAAGNDGHEVMILSAAVLGTAAFFHDHTGPVSLYFLLDNFAQAGS